MKQELIIQTLILIVGIVALIYLFKFFDKNKDGILTNDELPIENIKETLQFILKQIIKNEDFYKFLDTVLNLATLTFNNLSKDEIEKEIIDIIKVYIKEEFKVEINEVNENLIRLLANLIIRYILR